MGIENFIPSKWSAAVQVPLRKSLVFGGLCTREFEGDLADGDKVKINEIGNITVNSYTRRADITYQNVSSADKWLLVDQQKYFAFDIDDLDNVQSKPKLLNQYAQQAAYNVADTIDQFIAGKYAEAGLSVTAATLTAGSVLQNVTNYMYEMDNGNVNRSQPRYFVINAKYHRLLLQATTGIIGHTGVPKVFNDGMLVNGYIGELFGFRLLMSNNTSTSTNTSQLMAFTPDAIAMVQQLSKIEAVRQDKRFSDAIRGLYLYGAKVVRPDKLCNCAVTIA
jgi:hypothetical protein